MDTKGIVKEINGNKIMVLPYKTSGCGGCNKCCDSEKFAELIELEVDFEVAVGDEVIFTAETDEVMKAALVLYVLPIFAFFAGYFIAAQFTSNETIKILSSFGALGGSFLIIGILTRVFGSKQKSNLKVRKSQD